MATTDCDVLSKRFAHRVATMIDTHLIWYKHFHRWADQLIEAMDAPPHWLLEIATIKYSPDAVAAINRFAYSDPIEPLHGDESDDEHVACKFLRYRAGAISWATFLHETGRYTDGAGGRRDCEYFYSFLNHLEDSEYDREVEARQRGEIASEYAVAISAIQPLYSMFMEHFREYVAQQG